MRLVSIPTFAQMANLNAATVRSRIKSGDWPFYRLGERSIRVDVDEIRTLLRSPVKEKGTDSPNSARKDGETL